MSTRAILPFVFLATLSAIGCGGSPATSGDAGHPMDVDMAVLDLAQITGPVLLGVVPPVGYVDRTLEIDVTVQAFPLDDQATLHFGDGVTVTSVKADSATSLHATLLIDRDATFGPRDVTVTAAAGTVTGTASFQVSPPLEVLTQGSMAQGTLFLSTAVHYDPIPFDPATFTIAGAGISTIDSLQLSTSRANQIALIAPLAVSGGVQLIGTNQYMSKPATNYFSTLDAVTINEQSPIAVDDSIQNQNLGVMLATKSYSHRIVLRAGFVDITLTPSSGSTAEPVGWLFGPSGNFDSFLTESASTASIPLILPEAAALYAVVGDHNFAGGPTVTHDISFAETAAAAVIMEQTTTHAVVPGQSLSDCVSTASAVQPCLITGQLGVAGEVDLYELAALSPGAPMNMTVYSTIPVKVLAQSATVPFDISHNILHDTLTDASGLITGAQRTVAFGYTSFPWPDWTIGVSSPTGATGSYLLGIRPQ